MCCLKLAVNADCVLTVVFMREKALFFLRLLLHPPPPADSAE